MARALRPRNALPTASTSPPSHLATFARCIDNASSLGGHVKLLVPVKRVADPNNANKNYFRETTPLDTAGCLGLLPRATEPFLVMNGYLLTTLDFNRLAQFHKLRRAAATIAAYRREVKIDLGVLETDEDGRLLEYIEKPTHSFAVSMGIYCLEPDVCDFILPGERISMPELLLRLRDAGREVQTFHDDCYWLDNGRPDDYATACEEYRRDRDRFYPKHVKAA